MRTGTTPAASEIKVAAVQSDPQVGIENKKSNVESTLLLIAEAAREGARLIVLPELASTGYSFDTREEAYLHAESVPDGPTSQAWIEAARQHDAYVVAGILEQEGVALYDTAVLIGPEGFIGKYRKTHLWNREKLLFTPGTEYPVFDTKIGRIGLLICWDIWFPEVARILAAQGADIICSTNNWVWTPPPLFDDAGNCMASYLTMSASHVNTIPIVAADRVGEERGGKFLGCSLITGTNGWPIGGIADAEAKTIIYADLDLTASRAAMIWNDLNDLARDRRTDLYDPLLGFNGTPLVR
ncbi:hydratase [Paenarthrobacter sp. CM16]|uniref:nitrilase family protein n=1 Tax=unclassified Paenarthrobacter TaxID=2634190 RepID=UPI00155399ED|nr:MULTISPECIES: nitrilase family protein [unclassified Paenarthrobacter]NQD87662.1 hydratase [Paenarthrobacter sp. CM16]WGM22839.1 nitrilase family protein [Paenarthrobacter sp. OM7]